eukprot:1223498-Prorocentrum_lima.AAC.1
MWKWEVAGVLFQGRNLPRGWRGGAGVCGPSREPALRTPGPSLWSCRLRSAWPPADGCPCWSE